MWQPTHFGCKQTASQIFLICPACSLHTSFLMGTPTLRISSAACFSCWQIFSNRECLHNGNNPLFTSAEFFAQRMPENEWSLECRKIVCSLRQGFVPAACAPCSSRSKMSKGRSELNHSLGATCGSVPTCLHQKAAGAGWPVSDWFWLAKNW